MKVTILFGGPHTDGNTAALVDPFWCEFIRLGVETNFMNLYEKTLAPCLGCMACQDRLDGLGCVQEDDFEQVFRAMADCDLLVLATPIYAWYCTAQMKALMDRAIYAGNKKYGAVKGPALLAGKQVVTLTTCGYPPEKGADLWEEGVKRWCRHGKMNYLGMLCRQDFGPSVPFMDDDAVQNVRFFALKLYLSLITEEL